MSGKAIWFALCWLAAAVPLYAERVALVIGNGAYRGEMTRLPNPGNDARAKAIRYGCRQGGEASARFEIP